MKSLYILAVLTVFVSAGTARADLSTQYMGVGAIDPVQFQYGADLKFSDQKSCDAAYSAIALSKVVSVMPRKNLSSPNSQSQDEECFSTGSYFGIRVFTSDISTAEHVSSVLSKSDCTRAQKAFASHGKDVEFFNGQYVLANSFSAPEGTVLGGTVQLDHALCVQLDSKHSELHLSFNLTKTIKQEKQLEQMPAVAGQTLEKSQMEQPLSDKAAPGTTQAPEGK